MKWKTLAFSLALLSAWMALPVMAAPNAEPPLIGYAASGFDFKTYRVEPGFLGSGRKWTVRWGTNTDSIYVLPTKMRTASVQRPTTAVDYDWIGSPWDLVNDGDRGSTANPHKGEELCSFPLSTCGADSTYDMTCGAGWAYFRVKSKGTAGSATFWFANP